MNRKHIKFLGLAAAAGALALCPASAAFVTYTNDVVTFTPGEALEPVINGVVAAVIAGVALFTLVVGTRWVYRMLKASK